MTRATAAALCLAASLACFVAPPAFSAIEVLDAYYRPDRTLPEYQIFWKTYKWGDTPQSYLASGALAVYIRNTGASSITISDATINGASVVSGMRCSEELFYCDQLACDTFRDTTLSAAGQPIWYRIEPTSVPAGGTAHVFIRMRSRVLTTLTLGVSTSSGNVTTTVTVTNNEVPRVASYALSSDRTKLYLYLRHPIKGKLPTQILVDGVDKTSGCTTGGDAKYDIVPVMCNLGAALAQGSFHMFQAVYDDGSKATEGLRVYYDVFRHGRWGSPKASSTAEQRDVLLQMGYHSMNFQKGTFGDASEYAGTPEGRAILDQYGIKQVQEDPSNTRLYSIFLCDEPDAHEDLQSEKIDNYCPAVIGALSQSLKNKSDGFKTNYSHLPTTLNLNGSFKPYNYYIYGHVPDILSVDPYYTVRLLDAYWYYPQTKQLYAKATYIYAVSATCQAAHEPQRLHIVLNSCRKSENDAEHQRVFRWATPEEKRIEFYYALAAGAKEIDYWWFTAVSATYDGFTGIGRADEPGSAALWREIGLLGAEAGIAGELIVNGCPTKVTITKPGRLWARALVSNVNTLVLFCVNDDYACDEAGITIRGIDNAEVSMELPSWIPSPAGVFEIDYKGIHDVSNDVASGRINLHLGQVDVTRMIVITGDSTLKSTLQSLYTTTYAPRVGQLIPL